MPGETSAMMITKVSSQPFTPRSSSSIFALPQAPSPV
jgi:hypothetical protein